MNNQIKEVNDRLLAAITLEPILEQKLLSFKDFIVSLGDNLEGTPFGMLAQANAKEIYCFCVFTWSTVTRQGADELTDELVSRVVTETCQAHAKKAPEDLMTPEQLEKLLRYLKFFSEVIARKINVKK